ncbi:MULTISPECIES: arginase family protein [Microbacterium]|uniref:Arginase family protein n=1 Tax=Microbacterium commune TaxID=2762219 RepID=A0ABR8W6N6_9MICO|nr:MULTISPECIES: arginase family protein [Microbacterium]MBD8012670.1 arginase family protein [Microbacterium commune]OIU85025.1 formimidoylglutamase [Microbacterium sp. AR7-10]
MNMALAHDDLWPRAGSWPAAEAGERADAALIGIPTWRTSLSPTGAHATPAAIRDALPRFSPALMGPPVIDLNAALRIVDAGDVPEPDGDDGVRRALERVRALAEQTRLMIALGGDNSLTYPVARGAGADGLITLDAHLDLRDGVSNGSPVRRLIEDAPDGERIDPTRIVQIGIADFANSAAYVQRAADWGIRVITLDEVREKGIPSVVAEALAVAGVGSRIHLDIDVDVVDRAAAPGCPASVPGGLAAGELRALVRAIAADAKVASADIAEVDATADADDARTVRLAALCVLELLAGLASR